MAEGVVAAWVGGACLAFRGWEGLSLVAALAPRKDGAASSREDWDGSRKGGRKDGGGETIEG